LATTFKNEFFIQKNISTSSASDIEIFWYFYFPYPQAWAILKVSQTGCIKMHLFKWHL